MTRKISSFLLLCLGMLSLSVNAATLDLTDPVSFPTGGAPDNTGTISTVVNIQDYTPGASSGYYIEGAVPNALDGPHLQSIFDAASIDFTVSGFTKVEPPPAGNVLDTSSLGIQFEGFLMKVGNFNLVALFDSPITQLAFSNEGLQGISHIAYFNVSEIPVPAALFLFAPALLGFIGFRRRLIAKAA